jgi:hypothetical protein
MMARLRASFYDRSEWLAQVCPPWRAIVLFHETMTHLRADIRHGHLHHPPSSPASEEMT